MHLAVSGELVAVATSGGTIALYSAASLELAGVLPSAQGSQGGRCSRDAVLGCAFSPDGQALTACTAGGQLVAWHLADLQHPTPALMSQSHRQACGRRQGTAPTCCGGSVALRPTGPRLRQPSHTLHPTLSYTTAA